MHWRTTDDVIHTHRADSSVDTVLLEAAWNNLPVDIVTGVRPESVSRMKHGASFVSRNEYLRSCITTTNDARYCDCVSL